jgi:Zn-dependent protease
VDDILNAISVWAIPVIIAITFHEAAHGFVAWKLGDDTAYVRGRVTFNPFKHIDPFGTIILPGLLVLFRAPVLFGYAKPVPVNFARLRKPRRDMVFVAAAGPGANIALAIIVALLDHLVPVAPEATQLWFAQNFQNAFLINLILAVFNMIPLPPLDGGRVAVGLLPNALAIPLARLERHGFLILIALLFLLPYLGDAIGKDLHIFAWVILPAVDFLASVILTLTGHM